MEKKLFALFDYQRFEENKELSRMIREAEEHLTTELPKEDLVWVSAAGEPAAKTEELFGTPDDPGTEKRTD